MAKHLTSQKYVFKIHTSRLRRAKWNLTLSISEARENEELIALGESQLMRFIDEINGIYDVEDTIRDIKRRIRQLNKKDDIAYSRPRIKALYNELDKYQFKKDYACVVMDSKKDYREIYKNGFKINGITYRRLLGTTGGIKKSTIVFVNEDLLLELKKRIDNGRNLSKEHVPAKLEAYYGLVCSATTPVSNPKGVVVVHDCITHFKADVIELNDEDVDEPIMREIKGKDVQLNDSDGYGLAMPDLMLRWGQEIGEDFLLPGCVIRNAFCKGAVFPIDFRKFAHDRGINEITDVWGDAHNIDDVELVLTESMLKLWDSYSSIDDYLQKCEENHYTFAIAKSSEKELENSRTMNYQFLQSYDFSDEEIDELVKPTVDEIKDVLSDDYRKTVLYMNGTTLNDENVRYSCEGNTVATALMIEPKMKDDPYVINYIQTMISNRIDEAKIGVLKVPGNYSLVSGDPYSLCQSMFGLEVTGLLKAGEVYSRYWIDHGVDRIVSFRAPMTSHNNIRRMNVVHNDEMDEFYQYMTTPTIFNSWDTCADAMNGFDKDGDCVINTSYPLLVRKTVDLPAIVCVQRKASKCVPTEDDLMISNINSFGNEIGEITNRTTSMFEIQARFDKEDKEYKILDYRIKCGQLFQQNSIDRSKGIQAKGMPESWYNWNANRVPKEADHESEENKKKEFNKSILADRKPYFMQYVYPAEKTKLAQYIKKSNEKALIRFRMSLDELKSKPDLTEEEQKFLDCYEDRMPLGTAPCTINRICWKIESIFDDVKLQGDKEFDYSILKADGVEYTDSMFNKVKKIYDEYKADMSRYLRISKMDRIKTDDWQAKKYIMKEQFRRKCMTVCPNEEILCNIVLDLCYSQSNASRHFAWDICGYVFIQNLLKRHNYIVSYPRKDENGDIEFGGEYFSMATVNLAPVENFGEEIDDNLEDDTWE